MAKGRSKGEPDLAANTASYMPLSPGSPFKVLPLLLSQVGDRRAATARAALLVLASRSAATLWSSTGLGLSCRRTGKASRREAASVGLPSRSF